LRSPIFYVSPTHLRKLRVEYKVEGEEYRNRDNAYQRYSDPKHPLFGLPKQDALERWDILFEQIQNGYDDRYPLVIDINNTEGRLRLRDGHHRLSIAIELKLTHVPIQFREKAFGNLNMLFDSKESKIIMKRHSDFDFYHHTG
tara:strand:- start:50 stop:478 length:429 start_codon:yes stop_codon:yes gene_type:complete